MGMALTPPWMSRCSPDDLIGRKVSVPISGVQPIQEGGEMNGQSTPGSYGHMIMTLAQGLEIAVNQKWLSTAEAKREFRSRVKTVVEDKDRRKVIQDMREAADEMEEELLSEDNHPDD